jgi:hypothetical protein
VKNLVIAATIAVSALVLSPNAKASFAGTLDIAGCRFNATSDVGTSKYGTYLEGCRCRDTTCYPVIASSSCTGSYSSQTGTTISGGKCCANFNSQPNCLVGQSIDATPEENIRGVRAAGLNTVFSPEVPRFADEYFGYVGTTNRSPSLGRTTSIKARLDICMGSNDVDAAIATNNANTCYNTYCGTSYNEYCKAIVNNGGTSEAGGVCHDRCECAINGTAHSTCNQL